MSSLVKGQPAGTELAQLPRRAEIAVSVLNSLKHDECIALLKQHPKLLLNGLQLGYPLSTSQLDRYPDLFWDWKLLSGNHAAKWSHDQVGFFEFMWDWGVLSRNSGVQWSDDVIEEFSDKWDYRGFSCNTGLPWSIDFIQENAHKFDWQGMSMNSGLPWSYEFMERFEAFLPWRDMGIRHTPPWSVALIKRFQDKLDFSCLSQNSSIPWSEELVDTFIDRWNWAGLKSVLPPELQLKYSDRLAEFQPQSPVTVATVTQWEGQSSKWTTLYKDHLSWDFIAENAERWDWSFVGAYLDYAPLQFLEKIAELLDWEGLSYEPGFTTDVPRLETFADRFDWRGVSESAGWWISLQTLNKFRDRWDYEVLAGSFNLTEKDLTADQVDELLEYILESRVAEAAKDKSNIWIHTYDEVKDV